ncbi:MAG TPA: helicase HerA-like domain-containing protein [Gammaproteobacteria bacterium]|nr:helicase HerA-like domain-containing protein [Gammaproteobacteria bacterium]
MVNSYSLSLQGVNPCLLLTTNLPCHASIFMNINLGSIQMPINAATKTFAILAKRGAGKSYTGAVMAEEFYKASIPFVVFDPIDVWWGLRLSADRKGKGLPVVVFGTHNADITIDRDMGRRIAQAIVKKNVSVVISTFGMPKVAQRHLIAEFAEELLNINNTPRHIFIEEAHEFVPQRVIGGMSNVFSRVEALVTLGRNRGIGVTMLNQRAATLNKDVLTQIDTLLAFRNVAPQDRKALKEWVEKHGEEAHFNKFIESLPSLPTGEGWLWSPEFMETFERIKIRKRETFHPDREKLGDNFQMPELDTVDVESFIAEFSKEAAKKEKMPKATDTDDVVSAVPSHDRQRINELESQLIVKDMEIRKRDDIIEQVRRILASILARVSDAPLPSLVATGKHDALIENLPKYEKDIMNAIKQHPNIPFTRSQLAVKSNKSYTSSAFPAAIRRLVKLQLLEERGKDLIYVGQ